MQTIILLWVTIRTDWKKEASSFELIIFFFFLVFLPIFNEARRCLKNACGAQKLDNDVTLTQISFHLIVSSVKHLHFQDKQLSLYSLGRANDLINKSHVHHCISITRGLGVVLSYRQAGRQAGYDVELEIFWVWSFRWRKQRCDWINGKTSSNLF